MTKKEMANIAVEAAKLRKDYPELSYKQAIDKAKEVTKNDSQRIRKI